MKYGPGSYPDTFDNGIQFSPELYNEIETYCWYAYPEKHKTVPDFVKNALPKRSKDEVIQKIITLYGCDESRAEEILSLYVDALHTGDYDKI